MRPISKLSTLFPNDIIKLIILPLSTLWNHFALALTHLKSTFELILHNQYCFSPYNNILYNINNPSTESQRLLTRITRYSSTEITEQCAVCLSEIEDEEEIGQLRCCHVFHHACLQRWARHDSVNSSSCPLCRGSLAPRVSSGEEEEVIVLDFWSSCSEKNGRESWWLR